MELLFIEPTDKTPLIIFDSLIGKFEIIGISIPQNGKLFYEPALEWLDKYIRRPNKETALVINLDYFNISSSKMLLFIFYKLMEIKSPEKKSNHYLVL